MENKTSGTRKSTTSPIENDKKLSGYIRPASFAHSFASAKNEQNGSASSPSVNNPFLKCEKEEPEGTKNEEKSDEHEKDPAGKQTTNNLFKPTKTNLFANAASSALSDNSNFVFGQNLHERVVMENVSASIDQNEDANKNDNNHLFATALKSSSKSPEKDNSNEENNLKAEGEPQTVPDLKEDAEKKDSTSEPISSDNNLSLVEAARKYEEMRGAQKRKYEEVEITTGEEDERNILEINCKLFTFIENNYEERGRGMLRLNDSKSSSHSRVVFRASGSFRLLLNTKVWRDQICEQPSQKSLRLTAFDTNGVIKIYLVMGRNEDMSHLFRALSSRIRKEKDRTPEPELEVLHHDVETDDLETNEPAPKRAASNE